MIVKVNTENPQKRAIAQACDILKNGGVIIFPTDTVYAYGCDSMNKQAIENLYRIKKADKKKPLSFIVSEIRDVNNYARLVDDKSFKIMKKCCPGAYTFIFQANKIIPKIALTKQKTIGIRIPNNNVALDIVRALGRPLIASSVNTLEGEYILEPEELDKRYKNAVDFILDAGPQLSTPSTIVDFSGEDIQILREGKGEIFF